MIEMVLNRFDIRRLWLRPDSWEAIRPEVVYLMEDISGKTSAFRSFDVTDVLDTILSDSNEAERIIKQTHLCCNLEININTENCSECIRTFEGLHGDFNIAWGKAVLYFQNGHCDHWLQGKDRKRQVLCGTTFVHLAAAAGSIHVLKLMKRYGATFDQCTRRFKYSPLHNAIIHRRHSTVKYLLEEGVDLNSKCLYNGKHWKTAMSLTCENNDVEMVKILKTAGVDIDREFREAMNRGDATHAATLADAGAEINTPFSPQYLVPLLMAVTMNSNLLVRALIQNATDINKTNKENLTPIHIALNKGYPEITKTLLTQVMNEDRKAASRKCLLHSAIRGGNYDNFKIILRTIGPDVNERDDDLRTPLHIAVERNMHELIKSLLENGCDIDPVDKSGATPLGLAVYKGNIKIVRSIIIAGSDVNIRGFPRDLIPIANPFLEKTIDSSLFYGAVINKHFQVAAMLHEAGIKVNGEKWTLLNKSSLRNLIDEKFRSKFDEIQSSPRSLQFICRNFLRSRYMHSLSKILQETHLSGKLKEYLMLEYL